jgi:hypothetical protein
MPALRALFDGEERVGHVVASQGIGFIRYKLTARGAAFLVAHVSP